MLCAFGQAAPLNLEYQRANRVMPFPFHFLNSNYAMNVKPKNYSWADFYENVINLINYTFSWRSIFNRYRAIKSTIPRWMIALRAVSLEGIGRNKYYTKLRQRLETDVQFRDYFEQQTNELPQFFVDLIRKDLGPLWKWLPKGALYHDQNAYLKSEIDKSLKTVGISTSLQESI